MSQSKQFAVDFRHAVNYPKSLFLSLKFEFLLLSGYFRRWQLTKHFCILQQIVGNEIERWYLIAQHVSMIAGEKGDCVQYSFSEYCDCIKVNYFDIVQFLLVHLFCGSSASLHGRNGYVLATSLIKTHHNQGAQNHTQQIQD